MAQYYLLLTGFKRSWDRKIHGKQIISYQRECLQNTNANDNNIQIIDRRVDRIVLNSTFTRQIFTFNFPLNKASYESTLNHVYDSFSHKEFISFSSAIPEIISVYLKNKKKFKTENNKKRKFQSRFKFFKNCSKRVLKLLQTSCFLFYHSYNEHISIHNYLIFWSIE